MTARDSQAHRLIEAVLDDLTHKIAGGQRIPIDEIVGPDEEETYGLLPPPRADLPEVPQPTAVPVGPADPFDTGPAEAPAGSTGVTGGGPASLPPISASWASALPERGQALSGMIASASAEAGIDPRILAAVVWAESAFNPNAVSHAGAIGLAQLMPGTARGLGVDPRDPAQNLRGGARYLAEQLRRFGSLELALAAYNAGPGRVRQAGNRIPNIAETQGYVRRVTSYLRQMGALA